MRFSLLAVLCVVCASAGSVADDDIAPESAAECLDRFQSLVQRVGNQYAMVGRAELSSTDKPWFSKTIDWFVVETKPHGEHPRRSYSECRALYPHAPTSDVWERRFRSGSKLFRSMGDYVEPLSELTQREDDKADEQVFLRRKAVAFPNMFVLSLISPNGGGTEFETPDIVRIINTLKVLSEEVRGGDIIGTFYERTSVIEVKFAKSCGYLPTEVSGFFNRAQPSVEPEQNDYASPWYQCEIEWKKVGSDVWLPIKVSSNSFSTTAKAKRGGMELDAFASWEVSVPDDILDKSNIDLLPADGPVSQLRTELHESLTVERKRAAKSRSN